MAQRTETPYHSSAMRPRVKYLLLCLHSATATRNFQKALIDDNLPPSSSKCLFAQNVKTSISYPWTSASLNFSDVNTPHERNLFLVEMSNCLPQNNTLEPKGWTMRISRGGNIYSFKGAWGQAVAPQSKETSPFVDEVWQDVALSSALNNPSGGRAYFIHQAGAYFEKEEKPTLTSPWYSPFAGGYCSENSCSIAAWSQQAHLPTVFYSSKLEFSRYTNCGDGVYEHVFGMHNMATEPSVGPPSDTLDFFNTLWWGVRTSTFRDMVRSNSSSPYLTKLDPLPDWDSVEPLLVSKTAGYSVFAEHVRLESPSYSLPCGSSTGDGSKVSCSDPTSVPLVLEIIAGPPSDPAPCTLDESPASSTDLPTFRCRLNTTANINGGLESETPQYLTLVNPITKAILSLHPLRGVTAWSRVESGMNFFIFSPAENATTVANINEKFPAGTILRVQYEPLYQLPCGDGTGNVVNCSSPSSLGQPVISIIGECEQSVDYTNLFGKIVARCQILPTVPINSGDPYMPLTFVSNNTNAQISYQVFGVLYWSYKDPATNYFYIYVFTGDGGVHFLKNNFYPGLTFTVLFKNDGKSWDQNMAISYIHGSSSSLKESVGGAVNGTMNVYGETDIRYGIAGNPSRDFTSFTMRTFTTLHEGDTYVKRHFMIADRLDRMANRSLDWVNETYQAVNYEPAESTSGQRIRLFKTSNSTFGGALESETCAQLDSADFFYCAGSTTPQKGYYAHFAITCGSQYYFGTDRYFFSPKNAGDVKQPWICSSADSSPPSYKFLGFYPSGNCSALNGLLFDPLGCGA